MRVHRWFRWLMGAVALGASVSAGAQDTGAVPHGVDARPAPWAVFADDTLADLVRRALAENPDVRAAQARAAQAAAAADAARAAVLPTVSAEGVYTVSSYDTKTMGFAIPEIPGMPASQESPNHMHSAQAVLKAQYAANLAGQAVVNWRARRLDARAAAEDARTAATSVAGMVTRLYYAVAFGKANVKRLEDQVANYEKMLTLLKARYRAGQARALDVLQQRQQLEAAQAQLPVARSSLEVAMVQLAALLGYDDVEDLPEIPAQLPEVGPMAFYAPKDADVPALRAASLRAESAHKQESAAVRAFFPSLVISGQWGGKMTHINDTATGDTWSITGVLSVPLYQGGALAAARRQAAAARRAAELSVESQRLTARQNFAAAAAQDAAQQAYLQRVLAQQKTAQLMREEAVRSYLAGLSDYLNVLSANDALARADLQVLAARHEAVRARIAVLEAMGGRWTQTIAATGEEP